MKHSFNLGFHPLLDIPTHELIKVCQVVESLNLSTLWLSDMLGYHHVFNQLSAVALNTDRIHLGPGCVSALLSHPIVTGTALATLNDLAPNRVVTALCTGNLQKLQTLNV